MSYQVGVQKQISSTAFTHSATCHILHIAVQYMVAMVVMQHAMPYTDYYRALDCFDHKLSYCALLFIHVWVI